MMYEIIYGALKEVGLDGKYEPQDYLNFFCLGNREAEETPGTSSGPFSASNPQARLLKYPVGVDREGKVAPLPGCAAFPDLGGNICGSFLNIQENLTI